MKIYDTVYCNFKVFSVSIYKFFVVNIGENKRVFRRKEEKKLYKLHPLIPSRIN